MFGEEGELFVDSEDVLSEEIYSFEALELKCIEQVEPPFLFSVLPIGCVQSSPIQVPSLDYFLRINRLLVEPVVHGVGEVAHLGIAAAHVELRLPVHVLFFLT